VTANFCGAAVLKKHLLVKYRLSAQTVRYFGTVYFFQNNKMKINHVQNFFLQTGYNPLFRQLTNCIQNRIPFKNYVPYIHKLVLGVSKAKETHFFEQLYHTVHTHFYPNPNHLQPPLSPLQSFVTSNFHSIRLQTTLNHLSKLPPKTPKNTMFSNNLTLILVNLPSLPSSTTRNPTTTTHIRGAWLAVFVGTIVVIFIRGGVTFVGVISGCLSVAMRVCTA
jgi:hypothetical protein